MHTRGFVACRLTVFALAAAACLAGIGPAQAATVIDHANGYTLTADNTLIQFQSLAFSEQGKILAVGSAQEVAAKTPGAQHIDLHGKTVLPGLIDAHGHVFMLGMIETQVSLRDSNSLAAAQKEVAEYARRNPARPWIIGFGWNQAIWKLDRFPTAKELDSVVADRPVWLSRVDGHAGWANSRALQLAGITRASKDPVGGRIERDSAGNPSGVLVDKAMDLMEAIVPPPSAAESRQALEAALASFGRLGLTSVHDAGVSPAEDALYRQYADGGRLTTRVYGMISDVGDNFEKMSKNGPLHSYGHDFYALPAVKLYADGALGSRGAALLAPYSDAPQARGLLFQSDAAMRARIDAILQRGYQVNVHAIGDAGNRQIIDSFQALLTSPQRVALRNRIEHAQVVAAGDIARFKSIGIVPSMQPTHATSDKNMAEERIGAERLKGAYAWRSFVQQGSRIACGSDFPVESPNPFWGIHAAVTRQDMDGMPAGGWHAEQALSVKEALRCFTLDAAWAAHQETTLGSLETGKWADFIVVDQDLFRISPYDIYKMKVLQTWVAGRQVYAAP